MVKRKNETREYINRAVCLACAVTCGVLLIALIDAAGRIMDLEADVQFWSLSAMQEAARYHDDASEWEAECLQWQRTVENKEGIIEWYKSQPPKVEMITKTKEVEVVKEMPVEIERVVYQQLRDFIDLQELKGFLATDDTNRFIYLTADENGKVNFYGLSCEDYAFQLQDRAQIMGIRLDTEILSRAECFKWHQYIVDGEIYTLGTNDGHYINKAVIGNEVWFIEPQNDKTWLAYYLE